jgi:hypothetical protein
MTLGDDDVTHSDMVIVAGVGMAESHWGPNDWRLGPCKVEPPRGRVGEKVQRRMSKLCPVEPCCVALGTSELTRTRESRGAYRQILIRRVPRQFSPTINLAEFHR